MHSDHETAGEEVTKGDIPQGKMQMGESVVQSTASQLDEATETKASSSLPESSSKLRPPPNIKKSATITSIPTTSIKIPVDHISTIPTTKTLGQPPYSSFSTAGKKWIVLAATTAGFVSPFTAQIYLPALVCTLSFCLGENSGIVLMFELTVCM